LIDELKPKSKRKPPEVFAPIPAEILDRIVREGPLTAAEVETATRRFKKALIERALGAELSHHLGYAPGTPKPDVSTNHRNGTSGKTVLTDDGRSRSTCRGIGTARSRRRSFPNTSDGLPGLMTT
jgi:hypothetical protein